MTPEEEIAALKAENAALRAQLTTLVARVQELEARATTNGTSTIAGMKPLAGSSSERMITVTQVHGP
jgi:BMFP domain-containing protein YqiC